MEFLYWVFILSAVIGVIFLYLHFLEKVTDRIQNKNLAMFVFFMAFIIPAAAIFTWGK